MYTIATKGGRSRTGSDRVGREIHAIPGVETNGFWGTPAVCGANPGRKGYGWLGLPSDFDGNVTCEKCLKKIRLIAE